MAWWEDPDKKRERLDKEAAENIQTIESMSDKELQETVIELSFLMEKKSYHAEEAARAKVLADKLGLKLGGINQGSIAKAFVYAAKTINFDKTGDLNHAFARNQDANTAEKVEKAAKEETERDGDDGSKYGIMKEMADSVVTGKPLSPTQKMLHETLVDENYKPYCSVIYAALLENKRQGTLKISNVEGLPTQLKSEIRKLDEIYTKGLFTQELDWLIDKYEGYDLTGEPKQENDNSGDDYHKNKQEEKVAKNAEAIKSIPPKELKKAVEEFSCLTKQMKEEGYDPIVSARCEVLASKLKLNTDYSPQGILPKVFSGWAQIINGNFARATMNYGLSREDTKLAKKVEKEARKEAKADNLANYWQNKLADLADSVVTGKPLSPEQRDLARELKDHAEIVNSFNKGELSSEYKDVLSTSITFVNAYSKLTYAAVLKNLCKGKVDIPSMVANLHPEVIDNVFKMDREKNYGRVAGKINEFMTNYGGYGLLEEEPESEIEPEIEEEIEPETIIEPEIDKELNKQMLDIELIKQVFKDSGYESLNEELRGDFEKAAEILATEHEIAEKGKNSELWGNLCKYIYAKALQEYPSSLDALKYLHPDIKAELQKLDEQYTGGRYLKEVLSKEEKQQEPKKEQEKGQAKEQKGQEEPEREFQQGSEKEPNQQGIETGYNQIMRQTLAEWSANPGGRSKEQAQTQGYVNWSHNSGQPAKSDRKQESHQER